MKVYQTDRHGVFLGEEEADESPLEPGVFLIPAGCVEVPPPAVAEGKVAVWEAGAWVVKNLPPPRDDPREEEPPLSDEEMLTRERAAMRLSFAQLLIGVVTEGWITAAEGRAWRDRLALPAQVQALIATLPEAQQFAAETRAFAPSEVHRNDPLVVGLGVTAGRTPDELDAFFRTYANI